MWQQWVNAVLGLWVMAVPFLGFATDTLKWTLAVTGLVIAALAVWGASLLTSQGEDYTYRRTQS